MAEVLNRQSGIVLDTDELSRFTDLAAAKVIETKNMKPEVVFVDDEAMRGLNLRFREKDETTDVLSFCYADEEFEKPESLGEIIISAQQATTQASENGIEFELEIKQLILHGLLHLCGYDHETDSGEMNNREIELRALLGID